MSLKFYLTICFVQILLLANAMEEDHEFQPLLSIRLPYSVKRDEIINVPCLVYNYFHKDLDVAITLDNSDGLYEIIDFDNKVISEPKVSKIIRVQAQSNATAFFLIRPIVIGNILLKFTASSLSDFDVVHKTMKVVPEGITQYVTDAFLVSLDNEPKQKSSLILDLPKDLIPGSQHVSLDVVGDIMDLILTNLDVLVSRPTGCGEETMSSMLPNYLLMKYFVNSYRQGITIKAKLYQNLENGYQKMLNYHLMDGSFSSFSLSQAKEKPRTGSTWLTASFLRFLPQIGEFVNINETIIEEGLAYLVTQQADNGAFIDNGEYFCDSQRDHISVTVAAVLAFLRNPAYIDKYTPRINKGLNFIAKNLENYKSLHAHLLAIYASNRDRHAVSKEISLTKWLAETNLANQTNWWHYEFLTDVEITSYNLITSLNLYYTKVGNAATLAKRLIARRYSLGSFARLQKTVIGLINLIKFADRSHFEPAQMYVNIVSGDVNETIKLNRDNGIVYQSLELPRKTEVITIRANGTGSALMQLSYQYNLKQKVSKPSFIIKTYKRDKKNKLSVLLCISYMGKEQSSNMALLEVSAPSGFVFDDKILRDIENTKEVSYAELQNAGTLLIVYFDKLYKYYETCVMVDGLKTHAVAMQKPALVRLYDYYDTDKKAATFFDVSSKLCDLCLNKKECPNCK